MADLIVRELKTRKEVHRVPLTNLSENAVQRVMMGMLRNMSDAYFIDDSEIDKARKQEKGELND
jgi:hypothetical protein